LRAASQQLEEFDEVTRKKVLGALLDALIQLQVDVNSYVDSSKNPTPVKQGKLPPAGVKQGLEKKEGLFRKHMMVHVFMPMISTWLIVFDRANVSITLLAPLFPLTSTLIQTRLGFLLFLPES
jgi:hypothetical protein